MYGDVGHGAVWQAWHVGACSGIARFVVAGEVRRDRASRVGVR